MKMIDTCIVNSYVTHVYNLRQGRPIMGHIHCQFRWVRVGANSEY